MHGDDLGSTGSVLSAAGIVRLLRSEPPLIEPVDDPGVQVQPNGFDLTLESVWRIDGQGSIGRTNSERVIPARAPISASEDGWFELGPGAYVIHFREIVAMPLDVMAFGRPRSSVLRCGASIHTGIWDAGYRGRSEALLLVHTEPGIRLAVGARVVQVVFVRLDGVTHAYAGTYQGENLPAS